jgi:hypothetical protein
MRKAILIAVVLIAVAVIAGFARRRPSAAWHADTQTWTCPSGYAVYSVESEAIANRDSAVCVK